MNTQDRRHKNKRCFLVAIEGIRGSGIGTQSRMLYDVLEKTKRRTVVTDDETGTNMALSIKKGLEGVSGEIMHERANLGYRLGCRAQNIHEIRSSLNEVAIFRGYTATLFAQHFYPYVKQDRNLMLNYDMFFDMNRFFSMSVFPDLYIYLNVDVATSLERFYLQQKDSSILSPESYAAQEQVKRGLEYFFERFEEKNRDKILSVDASRSREDIAFDIQNGVFKALARHHSS